MGRRESSCLIARRRTEEQVREMARTSDTSVRQAQMTARMSSFSSGTAILQVIHPITTMKSICDEVLTIGVATKADQHSWLYRSVNEFGTSCERSFTFPPLGANRCDHIYQITLYFTSSNRHYHSQAPVLTTSEMSCCTRSSWLLLCSMLQAVS